MVEKNEMNDLIIKNFQSKNEKFTAKKSCGDNCGPCSCPGGDICTPIIGGSAESVGYAGGVAGDMTSGW